MPILTNDFSDPLVGDSISVVILLYITGELTEFNPEYDMVATVPFVANPLFDVLPNTIDGPTPLL